MYNIKICFLNLFQGSYLEWKNGLNEKGDADGKFI